MPHEEVREHLRMRRRLSVTIPAPAAVVTAAVEARVGGFTQPAEADVTTLIAELPHPPITDADLEVTVTGAPADTTTVTFTTTSHVRIPYWGWFTAPLIRAGLKRSLRIAADRVTATATDTDDPPRPRGSRIVPDVAFTPEQARSLAVICAVIAIANLGASLLGQNASYIANTFHASDRALGIALAVTRTGVLVSLIAGAFSDRVGRRRLVLISLAGLCLANLISAVAPTFGVVAGSQVFTRGFINALLVIGGIIAVEEAPDGARAFAVSMFSLAAGFGFGIGVAMLALNDLGPQVWRIEFAVSALGLLLVPILAKQITETRRFEALANKVPSTRARWREMFGRTYGMRFVLLAGIAFLSNILAAPSSQLTNRFLDQVQHFSAPQISLFRAVTAGLPGLLAVLIAGRLVDQRGRRPIACIGLAGGSLLQIGFFLGTGWSLWATGTASIFTAALAGIALGTLDTELFPTEARGTANALVVVVSVLGSVVGLVLAGALADPLGGLGRAIALMALAPIVAAVFLVPRLPEGARQTLEEISPSQLPRLPEG
jgi:MFS family permease